ncbi:hypothetical protein PRIPAC_87288 [Pristionchus pacificus]|uniref:Protein kinase domain-containing protein n=1 Tax=Pristionchus pacificus TaxID=54126 RepID=A0A2A6CXX1_PRIPA|nr:hypothetical protein PRIPAC_87288 [Pristionchus pacificus]|eukprot:PDM83072.1 protein kinase [Pristionchus pacificus]
MLENRDETDVGKVITVEKQLIFAIQIAYGLEYLSSRGFVHRDIAARNIMLDSQESCKIGDFGLARELGDDSENYQAQGRKLPLKWMPPEAIANYSFSTASDVWSLGVLFYEIVTLGATPYAGWIVAELLTRLKQGERMERPDNCSDHSYEFMRVCWSEHPFDRPTFTELRKHQGELLKEVNVDEYYLKLNANANYFVLESNASD